MTSPSEALSSVIEKVQKLLRLAQSDNAHEAALAMARAQELIDRHQLDQALLETSASESAAVPDEEIVNFAAWEDALDGARDSQKVATWRWRIAYSLSKHNAVGAYVCGGRIHLVGRPSDVGAVRYLFAYCLRETERLVAKQGKGHGRTWLNNYRLGVADGIGDALRAQREAFKKSVIAEARAMGGAAIVKVDAALARVEERAQSTREWMKKNMRLRSSGGSSWKGDSGARDAGRRDGRSVNLGTGPGIGAGARKALGGGS